MKGSNGKGEGKGLGNKNADREKLQKDIERSGKRMRSASPNQSPNHPRFPKLLYLGV